jgi:dTDP-4-dehydrorhamnose 3,5-epimerase-like enzyme
MSPKLIKGNKHEDTRGTLFFNNNFNLTSIKRIYIIENQDTDFIRAWQGHKIEQRWFSAIKGSFKIELITIDNWELPSRSLIKHIFELNSLQLDVLHIPSGCISSIQSLEKGSKLLVMGDYSFGEIQDEYRFPLNSFD